MARQLERRWVAIEQLSDGTYAYQATIQDGIIEKAYVLETGSTDRLDKALKFAEKHLKHSADPF